MPRSTLPKRLAGFPFVARLLAAVVATALLLPGAAWAADVNATPSNLASVYAAAQGCDVIHLAAGNYGTFSGGSKSSMVTLIAQPGAVASIAPNLGGSVNNVTFDGLTIQGVYTNGARNVSFVNSKFTSMARIDTPVTGANILFDRVVFDGIDACGTCYEGRLTVRGYDNTAPV